MDIKECPFCGLYGGRRMKKKKIIPDGNDMWIMLMSTVRYAMGRRTYMTGLAPELVLKYKGYLIDSQVEQIRDEVLRELNIHRNMEKDGVHGWLGDDCDVESWQNLLNELTGIIEKKNKK